ncbi:MAG: hypothetical protein ACNS60_12285 [Candidatus Cyclobacteriaceae bacterium M2_1C_046]
MNPLKSPVFIICCLLFIAHQVFQLFLNWPLPLIDSFLDNLLAMPVILTLLLAERKYLFKWKDYYRLTSLEVIIATLFIAFISEIVFPAFSDDFTGDWWDLLFLAMGGLIFYFTINPGKQGNSTTNT